MVTKTFHKIWPERDYTVRLYIVRDGNRKVYWWGIHPAGLLFPKDSDYLDEGHADKESDAWHEGIEALTRWSQVEAR